MSKLIKITSIKQLKELSAASAGAAQGFAVDKMSKEETLIREVIRKKIKRLLKEQQKQENKLRSLIRQLIKEGDVSDIHPHRSTAINVLEDVLKKAIPTLRTDYKRLTTEKSQRESFRAHILKAVKDSLAPMLTNWQYLSGQEGEGGLLSEPPADNIKSPEEEKIEDTEAEVETDTQDLEDELEALEEADVTIDVEDDEEEPDPEKFAAVEDDDTPSPEEDFGSGLEGMDETGRNMAYTSYRKVSQYILDAFDALANANDKEVFVDYLLTNLKLYFDKFEDELQKSVSEPDSPDYEQQ
jgi:hypothetical protein